MSAPQPRANKNEANNNIDTRRDSRDTGSGRDAASAGLQGEYLDTIFKSKGEGPKGLTKDVSVPPEFKVAHDYLKGIGSKTDKADKTDPSVISKEKTAEKLAEKSPERVGEKAAEQKAKPVVRDKNGAIVCSEYADLKPLIHEKSARVDSQGRVHVDLGKASDGKDNNISFPNSDGTELRLKDKFSGNVEITKGADGRPEKLTITNPEGISAYGSAFIGKTVFGKKIGADVWGEGKVTKAEYKNIGDGKCAVTLSTHNDATGHLTQPARVRDISALTDLASYVEYVQKQNNIASNSASKIPGS